MLRRQSRALRWTKAHQLYKLEIQEQDLASWVFIRTLDGVNFRRVAIGVLDRFESDATRKMSVVGSVVAAVGSSASAVAISGWSHVLGETLANGLGSGYTEIGRVPNL